MSDIVGRLRACANGIGSFKSPKGDYGLCDDAADRIQQLEYEKDLLTEGVGAYRARIQQLERENAELRAALKPFSRVAEMEERSGPADSVMVNVARCRDARDLFRRLAEQEGTDQ